MLVVNPDGSGETALSARGTSPRWSASGTKLTFVCGGICISDASGGSIVPLHGGPDQSVNDNPAWSPDGDRIAFDAGYPVHFAPPPEIWQVNADGTGNTFLTQGGTDPDWSPDGSKIAFVRDVRDGIDVMNADGSGRTQITSGFDFDPSWSPDGSKIAFSRNGDIYSVNPDGSGLTSITTSAEIEFQPVWSPDGRKIAFATTDASVTNYGIYVMNSDGSSPVLVADNGVQPDWQPIPAAPPTGPQPGDYKNAAQFCKADRDFLGEAAFAKKYGTGPKGANAYGKCVSGK
jgi:Tol biopolymer transport system component